MLETPFSEEEILYALSNFSGNKALDSDMFFMVFWQSSWDFIFFDR